MSEWRDAVRDELHRYRRQTGNEVLTLADLYRFSEDALADRFPENDHVQDKIRQVLQQLRNRGEVTFLDDEGTYRIEDLDLK